MESNLRIKNQNSDITYTEIAHLPIDVFILQKKIRRLYRA
jgi:hypothetical protein